MSLQRNLLFVCVSGLLLAGCQTDQKPSVSLSQAVKTTAKFEKQSFTPPPRKIEDVRQMLAAQSERTPEAIAKLKAIAAAPAGQGSAPEERARSYYKRAQAAGELGRNRQMRDDLAKARAENLPDGVLEANILIASSSAQADGGNLSRAIVFREEGIAVLERMDRYRVRSAVSKAVVANWKVRIGDLDGAAAAMEDSRRLVLRVGNRNRVSDAILSIPRSALLRSEGSIAEQSGRYDEAENKARAALALVEELLANKVTPTNDLPVYPIETVLKLRKISILGALARALGHQDRFAEAEVAARDGIKLAAATFGRNSIYMVKAIDPMVLLLRKTGRVSEARALAGIAIEILEKLGVDEDGDRLNQARFRLGGVYVANGEWADALSSFAAIFQAVKGDDILLDRYYRYNLDRATALLETGRVEDAAKVTGPASRRLIEKLGKKHYESAQALGLHAVTLQRRGNNKEALKSFRRAFAILTKRSRQSNNGDGASRGVRLRLIHEGYMAALMASGDAADAIEAFRVASVASSRSVQIALAQSAARAAITDPALRGLVRKEQDAQKQIAALYGLLSNAMIGGNVDAGETTVLRTAIDDLRAARAALMSEIERRFPEYAQLINPKPAEVATVQPLLAAGEAMIVTYVGESLSHVWALPAKGAIAFTTLKSGDADLRSEVDALRKALAPQVETLGDIPAFDVVRAHALYRDLLQPVAQGWRQADNLFIVAHGPLGYLPFALLPTGAGDIGPQREPLFTRYSEVPWLIRKHAVAMLPSPHALAALRGLRASTGERKRFAGFGDPLFGGKDDERLHGATASAGAGKNVQTAAVKTRGLKTRGLKNRNHAVKLRAAPKTAGLASAGLEILPRLPETADEIRNIAMTLRADLSKDVFIGRAATESAVKAADLSRYQVLAFATHGLIPGDLDGLSQPALALSAPKAVGGKEDGLLTMGEILSLKLDADWVVLSACNTGSGEGAGAEAVSGLGRAFFYAGTRALLVSNWPVETTSAMALTTDLFRRQYKDPTLARAQALRQAILALIDGPGYVDGNSDKTVFSYAHPIFWAPFSLVGDGGARRSGV